MIVSPQRCQCLLGLQLSWRQHSAAALEQVERPSPKDSGEHERRDPVPSAKKGIAEQEDYSEDEHLDRQQAEHSCRDGEARPFANIARNLRKLDSREMNLLAGQMRSVFRHLAEELADSSVSLRRA
jgi:hypothetical protein